MNERIRELMKECGIPVKHTRIDGNGYEYYTPNYEVEKFAELIVRECVMVGGTAFLNDNSKVPIFPAKQIREHFGVEE